MKNLAIVTLVLGVFIFAASSCKKVAEPVALNVIENAGMATIKGIAYAPVNDTTSADTYAPSGTVLLITVDQNQFPGVSTYGNNSHKLTYTTTVGAAGAWTIDVPAPKTAISVVVWPQDFRANYIDGAGDTDSAEFYYEDGTTSAVTITIGGVIEGASIIRDFWYDRM
jgi:hypothetical protein